MSPDSQTCSTLNEQRLWWNSWDGRHLQTISPAALRRGDTAVSLLKSLRLKEPRILEVGCGNGWLCEKLAAFGRVTGVDLADAAIDEAKTRVPNATFFAGDFCRTDLPEAGFDVVVTLETLSHVPDQQEFIRRLAFVLRAEGHLVLLTQNRLVYSRCSNVAPQGRGQLRRWVSMRELRALAAPHFDVVRAFTIQPNGHLGFLRIVNSARLNGVISRLISGATLESLKERSGLGQTLVMLARRRP